MKPTKFPCYGISQFSGDVVEFIASTPEHLYGEPALTGKYVITPHDESLEELEALTSYKGNGIWDDFIPENYIPCDKDGNILE